MSEPVYLDYNGTTPVLTEVVEAMMPFLTDNFGNPSSSHWYGIEPARALTKARKQVADLAGADPDEIVFTCGGTESNNYALLGVLSEKGTSGRHIITSSIEHPSVLEVCLHLERMGVSVTRVPVDPSGFVDPADVESAIQPETVMVSVMHANNETGAIQPIREISDIAHSRGILVHTDAAQSAGKVRVNVEDLGVDLLTLAGHKLYAPKGIGALYVKKGVNLDNLMFGAPQEGGRRPGTENVAGICGLGEACAIAATDLEINIQNMTKTRDLLCSLILENAGRVKINTPEKALPNTLSISFYDLIAIDLLEEIGVDVAVSAGAACHSGSVDLSHVLRAMGVQENPGSGTLRFSTGRMTTEEEVRTAARITAEAVRSITGK